MTSSNQLALKPYLEKITSLCEGLSKKELSTLILSMAKDVPSTGRAAFLEQIRSFLPGAGAKNKIPEGSADALIARIMELEKGIIRRIESIEDGSYWDDPDEWDNRYDGEEPDDLTEEHIEELRSLFQEAGVLFLDGIRDEARPVYASLFSLIHGLNNRTGLYLPRDLELREARARYLRCICEADGGALTEDFIQAMEIEAPAEDTDCSNSGDYPLIQDIIEAGEAEMEHLATFLQSWRGFLLERGISHNRTADLLLEVVYRLDGLEEVGKMAADWNEKQPRGYIFLMRQLAARKEWNAVVVASQSALLVLGEGKYRERISEYLIEAASALNDHGCLLTGKRERFFSRPRSESLADLLDEAQARNAREKELSSVLEFLDGSGRGEHLSTFRVRLLLMAGRVKEAFKLVRREPGIGWSTGNAGVVFGGILSMTADHSDDASVIKMLLKRHAEPGNDFYYDDRTGDSKSSATFYREIVCGLKMSKPTASDMKMFMFWAFEIGEKRIAGIVSNKHRRAYDRAAQVLGSLAESLVSAGRPEEAKRLLHSYYSERFNRYSAFRSEVRRVVDSSEMLKPLRFSF